MRYYYLLAISIGLLCLSNLPAYADCVSPPGKPLDSYYNPDLQRFVTCQDTEWVLAAPTGAALATKDNRAASWWAAAFPKEHSVGALQIKNEAQKALKEIKLPLSDDFNKTVDAVRQFVNQNTEHNIDGEFYSYWSDIPELLRRMTVAANDPKAPKPHTECSTRTALMYHILRELNIRSRPVVIYADGIDNANHTYLSVYNDMTQHWQIQDADYNVFWIKKNTKERASTFDLLYNPVEKNFVPCTAEGDCGYKNSIQSIISYFSLVAVLDIEKDDYTTQVNLDRVNADHIKLFMKAQQPYCELFSNGCKVGMESAN